MGAETMVAGAVERVEERSERPRGLVTQGWWVLVRTLAFILNALGRLRRVLSWGVT